MAVLDAGSLITDPTSTAPRHYARCHDRASEPNGVMPLHVLDAQKASRCGALCLDGSPPGIYYRRGRDDSANKWVVYFKGGGGCGTLGARVRQSCTLSDGWLSVLPSSLELQRWTTRFKPASTPLRQSCSLARRRLRACVVTHTLLGLTAALAV